MPSVKVELFDPAFVYTGAQCDPWVFDQSGGAVNASNPYVTDASTRYASGPTDYCTGDSLFNGGNLQPMSTKFTVRSAVGNAWDPLNHAVVCTKTYPGYFGALYDVLDDGSPSYNYKIAESFRRWSTMCTITPAPAGDYLLQVQSNVGGLPDTADAGNRFSIRATGANNDAISISGRENMGIFSNKPDASGVTGFYLARVPSGAAGQVLNVRLFDVGDSPVAGRIKILNPAGGDYTTCTASGVVNGPLGDCSFGVPAGTMASPSPFNGKWQQVSVPIPSTYTCVDSDTTACWVKLRYTYSAGAQPTDVTTWTANIEGDPVRLVQ